MADSTQIIAKFREILGKIKAGQPLDPQELQLCQVYFPEIDEQQLLVASEQDTFEEDLKRAIDAAGREAEAVADLTAQNMDPAWLAYWMDQRQEDLALRQKIEANLGKNNPKIDLVMLALKNRQAILKAQALNKKLTPSDHQALENVANQANPKPQGTFTTQPQTPLGDAGELVYGLAYNIAQQSGSDFNQAQVRQATQYVDHMLAAGTCRLDDPQSMAVAIVCALAEVNPGYQKDNPVYQVARLVEEAPEHDPSSDLDKSFIAPQTTENQRHIDPSGETIILVGAIGGASLGLAVIEEAGTKIEVVEENIKNSLNPPIDKAKDPHIFVPEEKLAATQKRIDRVHESFQVSPVVADIGEKVTLQVDERQFRNALAEAKIVPPVLNNKEAFLVGVLNQSQTSAPLNGVGVVALKMTPEQLDQARTYARQHPESQLAVMNQQFALFHQIHTQLDFWKNKPLAREIVPHVPGGATQFLYNIPGGFGQGFVQVIRLPQNFGNFINKKAGEYVGRKLVEAGAQKIGSVLVKEGLKQGLSALAKMALGDTALAATGVGAPVAVILAAAQIFWGVTKAILHPLVGDIKARDLITAPVVLGGLLMAGLPTMAVTATAVAASVVSTTVIATAIAAFLYLTAFTTGPLISTLAHLETGSSFGIGAFAGSYNGVVPEGCPSGRPYDNQYGWAQGPNGERCDGTCTHTATVTYAFTSTDGQPMTLDGARAYPAGSNAYDIGTPMGTPLKATHAGVAYPFNWGQMPGYGGYGNFVVVKGKCQGHEFFTVYGHMLSLAIHSTQTVTPGTILGWADNTGHSTGTHLHYEIIPASMNIKNYFQP